MGEDKFDVLVLIERNQSFSVDKDGNLSPLQVGYANTGAYPYSVAWSPSGKYIAVSNTVGNTIQIFKTTDF